MAYGILIGLVIYGVAHIVMDGRDDNAVAAVAVGVCGIIGGLLS